MKNQYYIIRREETSSEKDIDSSIFIVNQ